jgi:phosphoribosylformylglycinamidine (FGAM) synthase-like amidotransferase family enzyme
MKPNTLILRSAGTNCDVELAHAFELAGSSTEAVHLNALVDAPDTLERFDILGLPGGSASETTSPPGASWPIASAIA